MSEEAATPAPPKRSAKEHPQAHISRFWQRFHHRTPGKITSIFPRELYKTIDPEFVPASARVRNAARSYELARSKCIEMVRETVEHCESINSSFCDPDFDLESDFYLGTDDCIHGLVRPDRADEKARARPGSVHRVSWIFTNPQFTVDGFSGSDIMQGRVGNCWWLAGVGTVAHRKDLMNKVCVARDEECGVYGFVFFRDGEWVPTVIDDNLYLTEEDYGKSGGIYDVSGKHTKQWRKRYQTGSEALYCGKCEDEDETWLPLLEKAYAKVHGDYMAIEGGWVGDAVEDLTGGVTSCSLASRVLRKDKLWRELVQVDQDHGEFVYGLSAGYNAETSEQNGIVLNHAYAIVRAVEVEDDKGNRVKLLKIRNPWGRNAGGMGEWHGPWSDGSKEWSAEMIRKLRHEFGDDGVFWMSLEDMLSNFKWLHRTRLFDERWTVAQQWTSVPIAWVPGFLKTKFVIEVEQEGVVVIVLSKLDERYFRDLDGAYEYCLEFIVRASGSEKKIAEARYNKVINENRSINCEVYLKPGTYEVIPKVLAQQQGWKNPVEDIIKEYATRNPLKLQQQGIQHDIAHAKVGVLDEDDLYIKKKEEEKAKKKEKKKKEAEKEGESSEMKQAMEKMQAAMAVMQAQLEKNEKKKEEEKRKSEDGNKKEEPTAKAEKAESGSDAKDKTGSEPAAQTVPSVGEGDKKEGKEEGGSVEEENEKEDGKDEKGGEEKKEEKEEKKEEKSDEGEDDDDDDDEKGDDTDDKKDRLPWNPVCVMGLRVYAEDKRVTIKVVKGEE
ncbi:unnamed protein product [Clonostachys rosea]|uniref:Calpain catalytic domain-containing protein n=1 Tax=Bionectria ochroleuca TaxID=29856 RepID=A0ABY6UQ69_BIOOC|nr:unnamed protein product [Clonostachys rosea]